MWGVVGIALTGVVAILAIVLALGFGNGYSHRVVVQPASAETTYQEFAGTYSVVENGTPLCGIGDDYFACVEMHRTMYNSLCGGPSLNPRSQTTCDELGAFVTEAQDRYAGCGSGCTTAGSGQWGWTSHTLQADTERRTVDARPEVTREERCDFDLGIIRFGDCPGRPA